jgi:hypothetical protein
MRVGVVAGSVFGLAAALERRCASQAAALCFRAYGGDGNAHS